MIDRGPVLGGITPQTPRIPQKVPRRMRGLVDVKALPPGDRGLGRFRARGMARGKPRKGRRGAPGR